MSEQRLPPQFSGLEPFLDEWDIPDLNTRYRKRLDSNMDDLRSLYNAVHSRFDEIREYLDTRPLDGLSEPERRLARLMFAYITIAPSVEIFHQVAVPDCGSIEMFNCTREVVL